MKKILFVLLIGMLIAAFAGNVSANGEKVAYIAVNSNLLSNSELAIRSTLIDEGYVVTVIDDAQRIGCYFRLSANIALFRS